MGVRLVPRLCNWRLPLVFHRLSRLEQDILLTVILAGNAVLKGLSACFGEARNNRTWKMRLKRKRLNDDEK